MKLKVLNEWMYWDTNKSRDFILGNRISDLRNKCINYDWITSSKEIQKLLEDIGILIKQIPINDPPRIMHQEQLDLRSNLLAKLNALYKQTEVCGLDKAKTELRKFGIEIHKYFGLVSK